MSAETEREGCQKVHVEEDNFPAPFCGAKAMKKRKHLILKKNDYYRIHNQNTSACVNRSPFNQGVRNENLNSGITQNLKS